MVRRGQIFRRLVVVGAAATLAMGTAHAEPPAQKPDRSGRAPDRAVTLLTGDRVILAGGDVTRASVIPGDGRRQVAFRAQHANGKLLVIPADVMGLVASGRLDRRLFDVTGLIQAGYDDSRSKATPLIITYDAAAGRAKARSAGAATTKELPSINGAAVRVAKGREFLTGLPVRGDRFGGGVERVWLDGKRRTTLDQSVPQIGTPAAWQAGYTGKGITVAVLDTGIDSTHPDLADRVAEAKNFSGGPDGDQVGHGTHVASTIAGTAAASDGKYKGVAPDAKLLDGKVCGDEFCEESAILAGMQWAAVDKQADVINFSVGGPDFPGIDPIEEAVNTLTAQTGALFVVAAGNDGFAESVNSPGSADAALTVGAVDRSDELAGFSSRGPRVGDGAIKPDITAPGVDIVAAKSKDSVIGTPVGDRYLRLSGTSMATPHTAGAAALLVQQHPDWKAADLKAALMASAKPHPNQTAFEQGAGRVDLTRAIQQTVTSTPVSVGFGTALWPHDDDEPVARQITYRNRGGADITLAVTATLSGPDGQPAPANAVSLSASSVTIPAGGTATVTATSNTNHQGPDGRYTGRVTATAGDRAVTTPIAVTKEEERYTLTLKYIGPDGQPAPDASTLAFSKPSTNIVAAGPDGTATLRLPKDTYALDSGIRIVGGETPEFHNFVQPFLELTKDTVLTLDARTTKPIQVTVPRPDTELALGALVASIDFDGVGLSFSLIGQRFDGVHTAPMGDPTDKMVSSLTTQWGVPGPDGLFVNSPHTYQLLDIQRGGYFHGLTRKVQESELAKVTERYHAQVDQRRAIKLSYGQAPGVGFVWAAAFRYDLPAQATHFREARSTDWWGQLREVVVQDGFEVVQTQLESDLLQTYQAGRGYTERWNTAVFGPTLADAGLAGRFGDYVVAAVPMYSDQDEHFGSSRTDTAATKLYRNGTLIGESDRHGFVEVENVAPEPGDFKLVSTATRPSYSTLSTTMDAEWTFRSQTAERELLPLWAVRYFPNVDLRNAVKRQAITVLPVKLETQPEAKPGQLTKVEVRVSGDDGKTWTKAAVRRTAENQYVAVFATPQGSHVSLKANAADSNGNTTQQSIIRAYALR